nr:MAG TPA: hypothetical protein [Caudoviricetes sp.]
MYFILQTRARGLGIAEIIQFGLKNNQERHLESSLK